MQILPIIKRSIRGIATPFFSLRRKRNPEIEEIRVKVNNLPQNLVGCRLAVVADLHLPDNIVDTAELLSILRSSKPDAILLAGDLTNRYNALASAELSDFLAEISAIAPSFAIAGNHETVKARFSEYRALVENAGITFLSDSTAMFNCKGDDLCIYGVNNPNKPLLQELPFPTILLIHFPEHAAKAANSGCICAVCGHAHGGQVRFGKRGLFSPGQGFFPRYISGKYEFDGFPVIVSRGLGDSSLPIRIHNRPHLPIVILER